ncbi:pyridoxamine 5'-phosphate oxidase [Ferruginibacter sp. HRS2-29]|uniref:pyridoxamine 5'-phosphate oxidase n=1 Tax=Ferruginibacter sp. HRS2-29 TaxID=2487334 RepID=UPI0020CF0420|nr:pyridoxamine 5'-phosphate oxidase [Ferruginibacter sp. HRS2-29]MCP9752101.1 pyridoxamine 5'-phosphate oxidase [Ferruginibacter sp. HRS2-29]
MTSIAAIRTDYKLRSLHESDVAPGPFAQFTRWWNEAMASDISEVNAMTLATVAADGTPSARIVLLKGYDEAGFVFYTNYHSRKAADMEANNKVVLLFFWKELERQVRIEGVIEKVDASQSDEYFASRPEGSKIGAWASPQSSVIASREVIEENVTELEKSFAGKEIDRPPHWGGYVVKPTLIEFWQGRQSRLHDRIQYILKGNEWKIERLAP